MPQMFPMPFAFLMIMTMVLFLLSVIRTYWSSHCPFSSKASVKSASDFYFNQTW